MGANLQNFNEKKFAKRLFLCFYPNFESFCKFFETFCKLYGIFGSQLCIRAQFEGFALGGSDR